MKLLNRKYEVLLIQLLSCSLKEPFRSEKCVEIAEKLLVEIDIKHDLELENLLTGYYKQGEVTTLHNIFRHSLATTSWTHTEEIVNLIVCCHRLRIVSAYKAAEYLSKIDHVERRKLSSDSNQLIRVADHVVEDEREGFNKADVDSYLFDACKKYLNSTGVNCSEL